MEIQITEVLLYLCILVYIGVYLCILQQYICIYWCVPVLYWYTCVYWCISVLTIPLHYTTYALRVYLYKSIQESNPGNMVLNHAIS